MLFPSFLAFALVLLCNLMPSYATASDMYCLKSVMSSIEDPFGYLKRSWRFNNSTEGFICKFTGVECWHPDENRILSLRLPGMGLRGKFPLGLANCSSLTGLDLSGNQFSGSIPSDIGQMLSSLISIDLSSNEFSGEIPASITNCRYLNALKMDNNRLMGHIPPQIGSLSRLRTFSVAYNLLSGKIPASIANCSNLNELRMDNNSLMGHIPPQLGSMSLLKNFSVTNNLLSGEVPEFVHASFDASRYAGNPGLCGYPLDPCPDKPRKGLPIPFINGFTVGYLVCCLLAFVTSMLYCKKVHAKRATKRRKKAKEGTDEELGLLPINMTNTKILKLEKFVTRISLGEIKSATNNFSRDGLIWVGKRGTMHKGTLPNGCFVAVKKLYCNRHLEEHFVNEAMALGTSRHPNLVPLFGFCIDGKEKLLVYSYMQNRNLHHRLHYGDSSKIMFLDWPSRLKIAIGVARGLTWLHNNPNFQVFHLNITSKCILLDPNFKPKISSFGNAKFINRQGPDSSIILYPNTELEYSSFVRKDVHDFGMVLLEMITGQEQGAAGEFISIDSCNLSSDDSSGFYNSIDKSLVGRGFDGEIYALLRIACNCVNPFPDQEPTILEVFESVKTIGQSSKQEDQLRNLDSK